MMLLLLSVFPILLLLFALELEFFALAILTQGSHSPKPCISTVCKIEQLLTEILCFSHRACTYSQLPLKQLENIPKERRSTGFSFSFLHSLTKWEIGNPCTVRAVPELRLDSGIREVASLPQPAGQAMSLQAHKK